MNSTLTIHYSQYYVVADQNTHEGLELIPNGFVETNLSCAFVVTGTDTGPLDLTLAALPTAPALQLDHWDEVVEVSLKTGNGEIHVVEWGAAPRADLLNLASQGPGAYRLRFHARRRDEARAGGYVLDTPVEEHLISSWPSPIAEESVLKATDEWGNYWRSERADLASGSH